MKNINYLIICCAILFTACNKKIELTPGLENFKVSTTATSFKVGEEVNFSIQGSADIINFYSGEEYHQLDYRDGRVEKIEEAILSFNTSNPVLSGAQTDQFSVMASTDFDGNYSDYSHIQNATWVDITNRFKLATSATFLAGGAINITDLKVDKKPIYIAFKYLTRPSSFGIVRTWHVEALSLKGNTSTGSLVLGDVAKSAFRLIEQNPETAPSRSTLSATRITLLGNLATPQNDIETQTWAVSRAFNITDADMGPDKPITIKAYSDSRLDRHTYAYKTPGTYNVSFVAKNTNVDGSAEVVREMEITIVP